MYKCDKCKSLSSLGEKQNKVITQSRKKSYKNEYKTKKGKKFKFSEGFEIVSEITVCTNCLPTN